MLKNAGVLKPHPHLSPISPAHFLLMPLLHRASLAPITAEIHRTAIYLALFSKSSLGFMTNLGLKAQNSYSHPKFK
jgi:hypothetical protein